MAILQLILLVGAFVLLLLAALNVPSSRVGLGWAGLALAVLVELLRALP